MSIKGLTNFSEDKNLVIELKHEDGSTEEFEVSHSFNSEQIKWFKAGSALNLLRQG